MVCFLLSSHTMATPTDTLTQFNKLADRYTTAFFQHFPELALTWGRQDADNSRFNDHSLAGLRQWQHQEDDFLDALNQLDETALKDSSRYTTYQLLKESLENAKAVRVCQEFLWNINPTLNGWLMLTTRVAEKQPVGTPKDRLIALKRWQTFGTLVDDEIDNLKTGIQEGYLAPKAAVTVVLKQVHMILQSAIEQSPYFDFAMRDGDAAFQAEVSELIKTVINPALQRYANYLEKDYLPKARLSVGVSALPQGKACYQAKVKQETTLDIEAEAIYQQGLRHMEQLRTEIVAIGLKHFGTDNMIDIFKQAKERPEYLFHSEAEILNYNYSALERARKALPLWFKTIPQIPCILKPYPEYRAKTGASGEYNPPSEDGRIPGIFYINTYEPQLRSRVDQEATVFHELLPGHHFQIALGYENASKHPLDKYLWNSGFGEGWALYVERLADEMGLYQDDISRLGMLSNEALRAARLVVDPGLHTMHWTREEAITYLQQHTALSEVIIEGEVDRYIMLPGQATAYLLGKNEIESLRDLAKKQLQGRFDIREFHEQVLKNGIVSLPLLRRHIQQWLNN